MSSVAVGVFCKTPAAGFSKTRLSPPLRPEDCSALSACFIPMLPPRSVRWTAMWRLTPFIRRSAPNPRFVPCYRQFPASCHSATVSSARVIECRFGVAPGRSCGRNPGQCRQPNTARIHPAIGRRRLGREDAVVLVPSFEAAIP